ncbi:MAG: PHB depolymerase family esterase [Acidimicrobiia bacterium]|nr:PHB depolymerase family esterase [Acidimicrobiia bacterium]
MRPALVGLLLLVAGCTGGDGVPASVPSAESTAPPPTTATPPTTAPASALGPGRWTVRVDVDGVERSAVVVVPERLVPPVSLVLVFHGFAGSPEGAEERSGFTGLALDEGFVVAYPRGAGPIPAWRTSPFQGDADVRFAETLVADLDARLPIDESRVYAAGMSNGGGMAGRLACDLSDVVAAVAPVAAAHPTAGCGPARPVPVVAFHALDDRIARYDGFGPLLVGIDDWAAAWADRNRCATAGPDSTAVADGVERLAWAGCEADVVLYRLLTGGHTWPGGDAAAGTAGIDLDATARMWSFFVEHPMP